MEESYDEGAVNHTGPESCMVIGIGRREALTGYCAGFLPRILDGTEPSGLSVTQLMAGGSTLTTPRRTQVGVRPCRR